MLSSILDAGTDSNLIVFVPAGVRPETLRGKDVCFMPRRAKPRMVERSLVGARMRRRAIRSLGQKSECPDFKRVF